LPTVSGPTTNEKWGIAMTAWFAQMAAENRMGSQIGLRPDGGQALLNAKSAGCAMKIAPVTAIVVLVACSVVSYAQEAKQSEPAAQEPSAAAADTKPAADGLSDLDAMTFSCTKAGLNAAAREATKVPSQGTYQFSFFKIINDSHNSSYEIHFTSNYHGEADLKYCVAIYCQQGWDPKDTQTSVTLIGTEHQPVGAGAHVAECGNEHAPAKR
jgi:hypothetical protein